MHMREEDGLDAARGGAERLDSSVVGRCSTANDARAEIDEIWRAVYDTMAVAGPERAGSGRGVPVPSMTICEAGTEAGDVSGLLLSTRVNPA
jgi:hypothetical protein